MESHERFLRVPCPGKGFELCSLPSGPSFYKNLESLQICTLNKRKCLLFFVKYLYFSKYFLIFFGPCSTIFLEYRRFIYLYKTRKKIFVIFCVKYLHFLFLAKMSRKTAKYFTKNFRRVPYYGRGLRTLILHFGAKLNNLSRISKVYKFV